MGAEECRELMFSKNSWFVGSTSGSREIGEQACLATQRRGKVSLAQGGSSRSGEKWLDCG